MSRLHFEQPTITDVANYVGVSKKTVSLVINDEPGLKSLTREKILIAIVDMEYVPKSRARALALQRSSTLVLLHDNPNVRQF